MQAPDGWMFRQTRVIVPSLEEKDLEWLKKNEPFLVLGELQAGAHWLGVVEIPTILAMMGMAGPPGLFGYAYLIDPDETETSPRMYLTTLVGERVCLPQHDQRDIVKWDVLGVQPSSGALYTHIVFKGPGLPSFIEQFEKEGTHIVPAKDYEVPKEILSQVLARRSAK